MPLFPGGQAESTDTCQRSGLLLGQPGMVPGTASRRPRAMGVIMASPSLAEMGKDRIAEAP